jgi:hypothetical protein
MKKWAIGIICAILASIFIYPIFSGLILLPLDLLVSNSGPWHYANTILLKNPFMADSIIQMFPWKHLTFASLTHGIVPLWNPYQFMGMPFMAAMKPLVFYPANMLFILGEVRAWNILLWLQLFLSLWFTVLFVRSLDVDWMYALFAGVAFAFSSLMVGVMEFGSEGQVLLWLPVLLYFVKRNIDTGKRVYIAGIAAATACSVFAGQLQYFAYISIVVVTFSWFYGKTVRPVVAVLLGCVIAAVQLVPGIEMFQKSYRGVTGSYATFSGGLLKPYQLLRLLSPDWFGNPVSRDLRGGYIEASGYFGIIPLFFMLYAAVYERKNSFVRFFTAVAVVALLFSMDGIAQILYVFHVPIITGGYGGRIFSMFLFAGAVLASFGLSMFVKDISPGKRSRAILSYLGVVGLCFGIGVVLSHWTSTMGVRPANIKVQIAAIVVFSIIALSCVKLHTRYPFLKILFIVTVLVLTYGDLFRMGYRFLTFSNAKFLYPEVAVTKFVRTDSEKSLGRVYGLTEPEINTELGIYGTETYNPLFPLRTANFLQALENKQGVTLNNKYELTQNPRMKSVLDFLGVNLIVVPKGVNPAITLWNNSHYEKDLTKVFEDEGNDVYRNNTAFARFGLYYDIRGGVSDEAALKAIFGQSFDFRRTVLLRESLESPVHSGTGSAYLVTAGVNGLEFTASSSAPAVFYLSDSFDDGWHAQVNGRETQIYHANYNFRAVEIPAGKSDIKFRYMPQSVVIGGIVSILGILMTAGYLLIEKIKKREDKTDKAHPDSGRK